jgi:signal transduction histidine kinase
MRLCRHRCIGATEGHHQPANRMHRFLSTHRDELIERCKTKVAQRPHRAATPRQLAHGIPMFLGQLTRTLLAEDEGDLVKGEQISGPAGGDHSALSQIGVSATVHGHELLALGYTVDQVVHDYGDLCQSITDLAVEHEAPFSIDQFRTLNRCLDNAIADAVTSFSADRERIVLRRQSDSENERLGMLVHELRNSLQTVTMAFAVLESGAVPVSGSTGTLMKRGLGSMAGMLDRILGEVRVQASITEQAQAFPPFPLAAFIAEARSIAALGADARGCSLAVPEVDADVALVGNRDQLLAALVNLLQNAVKFTQPHTEVRLHAHASQEHVSIDVEDHCGGLPGGFSESMFEPFTQGGSDRSGLGLGLSIARRNVEAAGGRLTVRDVPGTGCVFSMHLPRHSTKDSTAAPG